jgi:hypothetical protein
MGLFLWVRNIVNPDREVNKVFEKAYDHTGEIEGLVNCVLNSVIAMTHEDDWIPFEQLGISQQKLNADDIARIRFESICFEISLMKLLLHCRLSAHAEYNDLLVSEIFRIWDKQVCELFKISKLNEVRERQMKFSGSDMVFEIGGVLSPQSRLQEYAELLEAKDGRELSRIKINLGKTLGLRAYPFLSLYAAEWASQLPSRLDKKVNLIIPELKKIVR